MKYCIPKINVSRFQSFKFSKFRASKFQIFQVSMFQSFKVPRLQSFEGSEFQNVRITFVSLVSDFGTLRYRKICLNMRCSCSFILCDALVLSFYENATKQPKILITICEYEILFNSNNCTEKGKCLAEHDQKTINCSPKRARSNSLHPICPRFSGAPRR